MFAFDSFINSQYARYDPGENLTLYQYEAVKPYGLSHYDDPPDLTVPEAHLRKFDPNAFHNPKTQGHLQVIKSLSGGIGCGAQVLLCSVVKAPTEYRSSHAPFPKNPHQKPSFVVAKVFDPMFFPGEDELVSALYGNDVLAEQLLSRESGAYEYLYERGKPEASASDSKATNNTVTGHPNLIPQYYGTWAIRFAMGKNKYRCAGLVLVEYIEGRAIEELCERDEETGYLLPATEEVIFHKFTGSTSNTREKKAKLTERFRLKAFREILHQLVVHMHIGVEHADFIPANVFITLRNHGAATGVRELDEPRPVLLDLTLTKVWRNTKSAQGPGREQHCLQWLPLPPHPMERASPKGMELYIGWFDAEWSEARFDEWLVQEFGPLEEGSEEGSTGKYSTFATLDKLEAEWIKKRDEDKRLKMKAQQDEAIRVAGAHHPQSNTYEKPQEEMKAQQDKASKVAVAHPQDTGATSGWKRLFPMVASPTSSATSSDRPSSRSNWRTQGSRGRAKPPTASRRQQNRSSASSSTESGEDGIPREIYQSLRDAQLGSTEASFASDSPSPRFGTPRSAQKPVEDDEEMGTIEEE
ncbi:hypothetical protein SGCOL_007435 [Colletotrichum sp. CLE4]